MCHKYSYLKLCNLKMTNKDYFATNSIHLNPFQLKKKLVFTQLKLIIIQKIYILNFFMIMLKRCFKKIRAIFHFNLSIGS